MKTPEETMRRFKEIVRGVIAGVQYADPKHNRMEVLKLAQKMDMDPKEAMAAFRDILARGPAFACHHLRIDPIGAHEHKIRIFGEFVRSHIGELKYADPKQNRAGIRRLAKEADMNPREMAAKFNEIVGAQHYKEFPDAPYIALTL